jgi:hypothetical protein
MGESASMTSGSSINLNSSAVGDDEAAHSSLGRIFDTMPESGLAGMSTLTKKIGE